MLCEELECTLRDSSMRSELGLRGDSKEKGNGGEDLEGQTADLPKVLCEPAPELKAGIRDCVAATA